MKQVVFYNEGELDIRALKTFGISAKENENPIGYFGTGLKYAIAVLLRYGCEITVHSGLNVYRFEATTIEVRNQDFEIIEMNGEQLAFTTDLGKNWELWQAFRELYCNALDEGGNVKLYDGDYCEDYFRRKTHVIVTGLEDIFYNRDEIVLATAPIEASSILEIHPGPNNYIYYRGVKVYKTSKQLLYTYNIIEKVTLTEDRTLASPYILDELLSRFVTQVSTDPNVIANFLCASEAMEENENVHYSYADKDNVSGVFKEVLNECFTENKGDLTRCAVRLHGKLSVYKKPKEIVTDLEEWEREMLEQAFKIARIGGYHPKRFEIEVVESIEVSGNSEVLGRFFDGKIELARRVFSQGLESLTSTLIEEYVHGAHGYNDETYAMQTFLFDEIVRLLKQIGKGEDNEQG